MSRPARGRLVDRLPGPPAQTARLEFRDTAPPAPGQSRPRHAEDAAQLAVGPAEAGLDPIHEADSPHRSRGIGEGARTLVDRPDLGAGDVGLHGRPIDTGAPEGKTDSIFGETTAWRTGSVCHPSPTAPGWSVSEHRSGRAREVPIRAYDAA